MKKYMIVRYEYPNWINWVKVVKENVTLEEAQKHCKDPRTKEEGKWFDGYVEM